MQFAIIAFEFNHFSHANIKFGMSLNSLVICFFLDIQSPLHVYPIPTVVIPVTHLLFSQVK